ncbi:hypothetical protein PMIN02_001912 [Paraphaeosphaeria minitans]
MFDTLDTRSPRMADVIPVPYRTGCDLCANGPERTKHGRPARLQEATCATSKPPNAPGGPRLESLDDSQPSPRDSVATNGLLEEPVHTTSQCQHVSQASHQQSTHSPSASA